MTLYRQIAKNLTDHIMNGIYLPGARLPGVRHLSKQFDVSISTIVQAQRQLENNGLIEARPRSGYYVCHYGWESLAPPKSSKPNIQPQAVTGQELVLQLAQAANHDGFVHFGAAVPDSCFLPTRALQRSLNKAIQQHNGSITDYAFPPGLFALRQQIARRMYLAGSKVNADDVLITNGCQESISLALQTVAEAGDIIAVESPTFYGLLQAIESLGMQALEIPSDPQQGMSLDSLKFALGQWPVKACVTVANYSNPLGSLLSPEHKQQLVQLANEYQITLIEDDIYGDLGFCNERPRSLHSYATQRNVIYCSSFSKTVAPSLRIGWVIAEQYSKKIEYLKYLANLASSTFTQSAMSHYLTHGNHERYLQQIKMQYRQQISRFAQTISKVFPKNTRISQPKGGFVLWVELDQRINTLQLCHLALQEKISIAPGQIFSAVQKYQHCIRVNCAQPWNNTTEKALITLGRLSEQLLRQ